MQGGDVRSDPLGAQRRQQLSAMFSGAHHSLEVAGDSHVPAAYRRYGSRP